MLKIRTMLLGAISVELIYKKGKRFGSVGFVVTCMCISNVCLLKMLLGFVDIVWIIHIKAIKFLKLFPLILLLLPFKELPDHEMFIFI